MIEVRLLTKLFTTICVIRYFDDIRVQNTIIHDRNCQSPKIITLHSWRRCGTYHYVSWFLAQKPCFSSQSSDDVHVRSYTHVVHQAQKCAAWLQRHSGAVSHAHGMHLRTIDSNERRQNVSFLFIRENLRLFWGVPIDIDHVLRNFDTFNDQGVFL